MKMVISALLVTYGLVFLGLSQRYDYYSSDYKRIDKLTGQLVICKSADIYTNSIDKNDCRELVKGVGILKEFTNLN